MKLGLFDIDIVSDGTFALDGGAVFGVVPRVLWERHFRPDDQNRIRLGLNCLLVRTGRENLLIDTGIGRKWEPRERERYQVTDQPNLLDELGRYGLAPGDVDIIVNSHLHFDHAGTNTIVRDGEALPAFPEARYVVQRGEFEHALAPHERDRASYVSADFEPLRDADQLIQIDGDAEIVPGITVMKVAGHNRDLQCVKIDSDGQTAFFFADLLPTTAHLPPAWVMSFDLYPVDTLEQKKRLVPQAVDEGWVCIFYHDPVIAMGLLHEENGKITVEPVV